MYLKKKIKSRNTENLLPQRTGLGDPQEPLQRQEREDPAAKCHRGWHRCVVSGGPEPAPEAVLLCTPYLHADRGLEVRQAHTGSLCSTKRREARDSWSTERRGEGKDSATQLVGIS